MDFWSNFRCGIVICKMRGLSPKLILIVIIINVQNDPLQNTKRNETNTKRPIAEHGSPLRKSWDAIFESEAFKYVCHGLYETTFLG